jgi:large subunit ribosomal protein L13
MEVFTVKTYMAKPETVERKWYIVDATDVVLGRLSSQVASILRGKNKPTFTPHVDTGDYVIVINCEKVVLTGKKLEQKYYTYHTGYIGGLKQVQYKKIMNEKPEFAVHQAVKGMLPKNTLGRKMIKKLKVYAGSEHEHQAQCPIELKL